MKVAYPTKILIVILWSPFTAVHSQEHVANPPIISAEIASLSASKILSKAKKYQHTNYYKSMQLANVALHKSETNSNHSVSAGAHLLLGKLARESNDISKSKYHLLKASLLYKEIEDEKNQIKSMIDYVKLLFIDNDCKAVKKVINDLWPSAEKYADKIHLDVFLVVQGNCCFKEKNYTEAVVQYKQALKYIYGDDKTKQEKFADAYHRIAQSFKHLKKHDQAFMYYEKENKIYSSLGENKAIIRTLHNLAMIERYRRNYAESLDYSTKSLELIKQYNDPELLAKELLQMGIIYRYIGLYEKSLNQINKAHAYYKQVNNISKVVETSNHMGLVYTKLKQFDQARSFYQLTIDLPQNKVKPKTKAAAYREMSVVDLEVGNYAAAMISAEKAYQIYEDVNDKIKLSITARIIGNIYSEQNKSSQAIAYYRKALASSIDVGDEKYQIKDLVYLGRSLIDEDPKEAAVLLNKSLRLLDNFNLKNERLSVYSSLRRIEKILGNTLLSLSYAEKEIALSKVIQKEKDKKEFSLEKAKIYSHKIEMELEALKEKRILDQLELTKKNNGIEIAEKSNRIYELEITKNIYAIFSLTVLLIICLVAVLFFYRRFTTSNELNIELDYLASHDPLTNYYNRRTLFEVMNRDFEAIELLGEYCVIMADIDHFKTVNDNHGHVIGDAVLCGVANILKSCMRQSDIAARYGGEEFCLVLPGASQFHVMTIAEEMRQKIEESHFSDIDITCSFGVTSIKFNAKSPEEIINQADLALYNSKNNGRNQVTLWNKSFK